MHIDPPMRMGPLEDEEDASDADEEASLMPTEPVADFVDLAETVLPPAIVDYVLHQILHIGKAIQTQQEHQTVLLRHLRRHVQRLVQDRQLDLSDDDSAM